MARRRRNVDFAMEIAPVNLIDLVLILLIFFITTTTFLNLKLIELTLPEASAKSLDRDDRTLVLSIDRDGNLFADKRPLTLEALPALLRERRAAEPELSVLVAADAQSRHEAFVALLSLLKAEQVGRIGIVTETHSHN